MDQKQLEEFAREAAKSLKTEADLNTELSTHLKVNRYFEGNKFKMLDKMYFSVSS